MKIRRLKSGNYNTLVYSHTDASGKRHYESITAESKAEVMRRAGEFKQNRNKGELPLDLTVGECIDRYIKAKEKTLSPATIRGYRQCEKMAEEIKDIRLSKFTNEQFQTFVGILASKYKYKTVKNVYSIVAASIEMFSNKRFRITLPPRNVVEYHIPDDKDIKELIAMADSEMKMCIGLASTGTIRRGEICGLKHKDIDREHNTVYVHGDIVLGMDGWVYKETPKTSSSIRRIEIPEAIINLIPDGDPNEYIYTKTPNNLTDDFIKLRNKLGLKCRFHDLRHYAASILHAIGVPDQYIMERGGWKSDFMLKAVYRNTLSDKSAAFSKIANDYFNQTILSGKEAAK